MSRSLASVGGMCVLLLVGTALLAPGMAAQERDSAVRTLQGQVTDGSNAPVADAVVYLKNTKDLSVKTYISDKQGNYRFNALSANADYEVHAEVQDGRRTDVRRLSSFDSRKLVQLNLRLK